MNIKTRMSFVAVALAALSACNDDNNHPTSQAQQDYETVIAAMGGEQAIKDIQQITLEVEGSAYDSHESPEPEKRFIADYHYTMDATPDARQVRQQWSIDTSYAFVTELSFTEVINQDSGVVLDGPNTFASYAFGSFGVAADAMTAAKVGTRQKSMFMSSPVAIVTKLLEKGEPVPGDHLTVDFHGYEITLVIDPETGLLSSAQTTEYDPLLGDISYVVDYSDWQVVQESVYPYHITYKMDGEVVREDVLSSVSFVDHDESLFEFSAEDASEVNRDKLDSGYASSLYYTRGMMMGFPFDAVPENNVQSEFIDSENKVLRISGIEHYNYAFLIGDKVFIYDAPISNERQLVVLGEVSKQFPGKEIGGVILSHNHFDHAGGFRGALSGGGNLITGKKSVSFYQQLLSRPHTLRPNPLADRSTVEVIGVDGTMVLGEGSETLALYTLSEGHAEEGDMIVLYRPHDKTLFFADLYNSGFGMLQNFYPNLSTTIQQRAQMLVDFVQEKGLEVNSISPLHGDVWNDNSYESVKAAASFFN